VTPTRRFPVFPPFQPAAARPSPVATLGLEIDILEEKSQDLESEEIEIDSDGVHECPQLLRGLRTNEKSHQVISMRL
jgi:hypothetical protein